MQVKVQVCKSFTLSGEQIAELLNMPKGTRVSFEEYNSSAELTFSWVESEERTVCASSDQFTRMFSGT